MSHRTHEGYVHSDVETRIATGTGVAYSNATPDPQKPFGEWTLQVIGQGATPTAWEVALQTSLDGVNYQTLLTHKNGVNADGAIISIYGARAPFYRTNVIALTLGSATGIKTCMTGAN